MPKYWHILIIILFFCPVIAVADDAFFVQVGAFRDLSNANLAGAEQLGSISKEVLDNGVTRVKIVGISTRQQALQVLQSAREAGYQDAFVGGTQADVATMTIPSYTGPSDQRINAARAKVSPDRYQDIVFLDGKLVLKEGENFRALE